MRHLRMPNRDPELARIDRENAVSLAGYFRKRAAQLRSKPHVLVSDLESHRSDIARYDTRAAELEQVAK